VMNILFALVILSEIVLAIAFVTGLSLSRLRSEPLPRRGSKPNRYVKMMAWLPLTIISVFGTVILGILDWNTFIFDHWIRLIVGGVLIAGALALAFWAVRSLGFITSMGIKGAFVVSGAYKYSRNPQYVAYIVLFAGYAILCNSALTFVAVVIPIVLSFLAPFREEPRLRERFGSEYDDYFVRVPRFIPLPGRNRDHAA